MPKLRNYIFECEFNVSVNGIFYHHLKQLFIVHAYNRDYAISIVTSIFSDNDCFQGAKLVAVI